MQVRIIHDGTILQIQWWPTSDAWNQWSVTKMLDLETMGPLDAFASISSPQRMTATSMRWHVQQLELAIRLAEGLDRAIGTQDAIKVLTEEIDILPTPYSEWPHRDPVVVYRNRMTGRTAIKYQEQPS